MSRKLLLLRKAKRYKEVQPTLPQVLYTEPNPDGSAKRCGNCYMWVDNGKRNGNQCIIHEKSLDVDSNQICGYHIFGKPRDGWRIINLDPVNPKYSGLKRAKSGAICGNCQNFIGGRCQAVREKAKVHPKGGCVLWEKK